MFRPAVLSLAAVVAFASWQASAQTVTLKIATFTPAKSNATLGMYEPYIEAVKKELGDKVQFQRFYGGSLGRNPDKQFELVKNGIADINLVVPGYTPGVFPGFSVFELPFLVRDGVEGSVASWRMYKKGGHLGGLDDTYTLTVYTSEPYGIHAAKPMKTPDDIKGMKVRSGGSEQSETIKALGAIPIGMPASQITESLNRGVIDAALIGWGGANSFRVYQVTKYHYTAPLGALPLLVLANKQKWASLPADVRASLEKHGGEWMSRKGGGSFDSTAKELEAKMKMESGRVFIEPTKAELDAGSKRFEAAHRDWIKSNKNGQVIYDALNKILVEYRAGS